MFVDRGPTGDELRTVRDCHNLTVAQCAATVDCTPRQWHRWESGDAAMPRAAWWLLLLRLGQVKAQHLPKIPERVRAPSKREARSES